MCVAGGRSGDRVRALLTFFSPGRLVLALSLLIAGYLLFTAGGNLLESHRLAENEDQLRAQVDALHVQETQLEQVRDYLRSDAYIEFMARRVFGFVKPGESLVIVQAPPSAADDDSAQPPGQPWWQQLFGR